MWCTWRLSVTANIRSICPLINTDQSVRKHSYSCTEQGLQAKPNIWFINSVLIGFALQLGHKVHAVDFSSAGLDKTRKLATEQGIDPNLITCHCSDVTTWQPPQGPGSLDAIIASFCHIPPEYKQQHYNNVRAMLKPGEMGESLNAHLLVGS
jgi:hypothetical protein